MNEVKEQRWASTYWNGDFYLIETWSGYRGSGRDLSGKQHTLGPEASADELGVALLDALSHSRFLELDELDKFFDYNKGQREYEAWIQALIERHGYKSKRALFKSMANCGVRVADGVWKFRPCATKNSKAGVEKKTTELKMFSFQLIARPLLSVRPCF